VHNSVCFESATTLPDPSALPVRRCAHDRNGITTSDVAASAMPSGDVSGLASPSRARSDSTVT